MMMMMMMMMMMIFLTLMTLNNFIPENYHVQGIPAQSATPVPCTWSSKAIWLDQLTLLFPGQHVFNTVNAERDIVLSRFMLEIMLGQKLKQKYNNKSIILCSKLFKQKTVKIQQQQHNSAVKLFYLLITFCKTLEIHYITLQSV